MYFFYKYYVVQFLQYTKLPVQYSYYYLKMFKQFTYFYFAYTSTLKVISKTYFTTNNLYLNHLYFLSLVSFKMFLKKLNIIKLVITIFSLIEEKNFIFFFKYLKWVFVNLTISKHTQFILSLKLFFKTLNVINLLPIKTRGFFIKFKGKIGFTGNLRKRHIFWYSNYLTKSDNTLNFLSKRQIIITKSGIFTIHILIST